MDATMEAATVVKKEENDAQQAVVGPGDASMQPKQEEPEVKQEEQPSTSALPEASKQEQDLPSSNTPKEEPAGEAEKAGPSSSAPIDPDDLLKEFYSDVKDVDRDNEVNRIIWAFKLNPFEKLNLRFDVPIEEVKKQYRKLSLMVHPDKCKHPQASTAFDILGDAQKQLNDEEQRNFLMQVLDAARDEVRKERRKSTKHDSLVRLASMLNEAGRQGVEEAWEQSEEFHEQWRVKARDYLARTEWKRRKTIKRLKDEVAKSEAEMVEAKEKAKKDKELNKKWEQTRDERVNGWRDFVQKKRSAPSDDADKPKAKKAIGELRPPKLKTSDEDKLYVSRNVTEQFRPESQQVKMKPNQMKQPHAHGPRR